MILDKYDIFILILKYGSLTKTAQETGYTQSGISHMVTALEEEMGASLLFRSRSGVALTPEGEMLFPYIQSVSQSRRNMWECSHQIQGLESGTVRIGTLQSITTQILPHAISRFNQLYPGVNFQIITGGHNANTQNVLNGIADFGFVCTTEEHRLPQLSNCEVLPFTTERMVAIISENHPLAGQKFFPVDALQKERFVLIRDWEIETRHIFIQHDVTPHILFELTDAYSIMAMINQGVGISIIPEMSAYRNPYRILAKELSVPAYRHIGILYRKHPFLSHAAQAFIDMLMESRNQIPFIQKP